jgi:hypothetical protein
MTRSSWLIGGLTSAVIILVAALMFMVGRATAPTASPPPVTIEARKPAFPKPKASKAEPLLARGSPSSIPNSFVGEWNEKVEDCGTGNNATRLRIEPKRVRFYESEAGVKRVTAHNRRAITVEGSFADHEQVWADSFKMVLSGSGKDLTMDGLTRHRCPT